MSVAATTNATNGTWKAVRATTSQSSGKYYLEFTSAYIANNGFLLGFGNASLNTASYVGSDGNSFGYQSQGSTYGISGGWQGFTTMGTVIQVAVDLTAKLVWARTDRSTNWNNNGSANPATGVGGYTYTTTGALFPAVSILDGSGANTVVINAGGFTFAGAIPSGFSAWDTGVPFGALNHTTTTWDSTSKNANVTLSNGNLTASQSSATATWCGVRSTTAASYGQVYYEITVSAYDGGNGMILGLADSSWAVATNNQYVGVDTHSTGVQAGLIGAGWQFSAVNNNGQPGFQQYGAHVLAFAVDFNVGLVWVKNLTSGGDWNNDASADPLTGKRGAAIVCAGAVYIAAALYRASGVTDTVVLNTGGSAFTGTKPTGYIAWDTAATAATYATAGPVSSSPVSGYLVALPPSEVVSESANAGDLYTATTDYAASLTESATATDAFGATEIRVDQFLTESLLTIPAEAYIDQYVIEVLIPPIVTADITETANATDEYPGGAPRDVTITEAAAASDSYAGSASYNVSQTETASASDSLTPTVSYLAHIDETSEGGGGAAAGDGFASPDITSIDNIVTETALHETALSEINALATETMMFDSPTTSTINAVTTETLLEEPTTSTVNSFVVETLLQSRFNAILLEDGVHLTDAFIPQRIGAPKAPPDINVVSSNVPSATAQQPYPPVATNLPDWQTWNQQIATTLNLVLSGKQNNTLASFTLKPNTTTTTLFMSQIGANSVITLTPLTENAANEKFWITDKKVGQATINHSNAATTDRTFSVMVNA